MKHQYSRILFILLTVISFLKPNEIKAQCVTGAEFNSATPKKDMRGVFLPSVASITWPSNRNATPAVQRAELLAMLDKIEANGYNSVFLQVRPESDALYPSALEPWSYWLTGAQGIPPSPLWDPLDFAINESHLRGLDLHAWLNPYRAKRGSDPAASTHVTVEHPEWIFTASNNSNLKIVNPGIPAVTDYIVSVVEDLATRYDLDGIHFDDYFYPNGGMTNQDSDAYANYNPGGLSLADWRRNNVNQMIGEVYDAIQGINSTQNKNIVFGVSPAGIWKSGTPSGTSGNPSYSALYCDPIAWMQADKVDYIAPQLYWKITGPQDYNALSQWWNDQAVNGAQIYISQAYYKMIDSNNWGSAELQNQINKNRTASMDATFGQIAYRYNEIGNNDKGINTALNAAQFKYKSFAPPILGAGKDAICANKPENIRFESLKLMWDTPAPASDGDLPQKYVVYAFNNAAQAKTNKNDGSKILDIVAGNELTLTQQQIDTKYFVVTSLDKNNNESGDFCNFPLPEITASCSVASIAAPTAKNNCTGSFTATTATVFPIESSTVVTWNYDFGGGNTFTQAQKVNIEDDVVPTIAAIADQTVSGGATCEGILLDYSALAVVDDNCDEAPAVSQSPIAGTVFTGTTTVTLSVTDASGNSATTTFDVSVLDTTAPEIINMPSNMVLSASITCDALAIWSEPTVIDNCNSSPIVTSDWSSGDVFPSGITVITYIASDGINTSTASFTITVVDDESPTIECPADLVVDAGSNNQYILPDYTVDAIVFDNCTSNPVVSQSPIAGTVVAGGSIIDITQTAIDVTGNIGSCTFELTVVEYLSITETTFNENEIIVYPNPAKITFNIQNDGSSVLNKVDIFDFSGRLIRTFPIKQDVNFTQLDVSRIAAGVYWIAIYSENNRIIKRLIIE